jgi:hypothetical protein
VRKKCNQKENEKDFLNRSANTKKSEGTKGGRERVEGEYEYLFIK